MKRPLFFRRRWVFLSTVFLTGMAGGLMMVHNFNSKGKSNKIRLPVLSILMLQIIIWVTLYYFLLYSRQLDLNKTIGWGWDITNFARWFLLLFNYFTVNFFLGLILIFPIWNKCVKSQQQNDQENL
jgi:hypothetical protein